MKTWRQAFCVYVFKVIKQLTSNRCFKSRWVAIIKQKSSMKPIFETKSEREKRCKSKQRKTKDDDGKMEIAEFCELKNSYSTYQFENNWIIYVKNAWWWKTVFRISFSFSAQWNELLNWITLCIIICILVAEDTDDIEDFDIQMKIWLSGQNITLISRIWNRIEMSHQNNLINWRLLMWFHRFNFAFHFSRLQSVGVINMSTFIPLQKICKKLWMKWKFANRNSIAFVSSTFKTKPNWIAA